jgi:hypothetical protein
MLVLLQTVARGRVELDVAADVSVAELRRAAAAAGGLALAQTRLVSGGRVLNDSDGAAGLSEGAKVFALAAPEAQPARGAGGAGGAGDAADDADGDAVAALRLHRVPGLHPRVRAAASRLVAAGAPEPLLVLALSVRLRTWLILAAWCLASRAAAARELGAPFVLATGFALIFANLGRRKEGEASAYSIYNPGFAPLPGALAPEELERQLRAGHM